MRYQTIVVYDNDERFDELVEAAIADGWRVEGGVSVAAYHVPGNQYADSITTVIYAQAMTRTIPSA